MKSDRELLELATKAYGINPIGWHDFNGILYEDQNGVKKWFNPRDEDGDSMRLAVRLKIDILNDDSFCGANSGKLNFIVYEDHMDDPIMAVRRAILRAAAAIGGEDAMNAPMRNTPIKNIYGKSKGIQLPDNIRRLMLGAEIVWFDNNPLSQDMDESLHFFFDSKTNPMTDLLLRKSGLTDVSQYVNIPLRWHVAMSTFWAMPNRPDHRHEDCERFEFRGTVFPITEKFRGNRDRIYMRQRLEYLDIPDENKNKKVYATTKFLCTVVGI